MGFWRWLAGSRKAKKGKTAAEIETKVTAAFGRVRRDIKKVKNELSDINGKLSQQDKQITENTQKLSNHTARLDKLENIVNNTPTPVPEINELAISRPSEPTSRLVATNRQATEPLQPLDMHTLSAQEKRIISIFLSHRDMTLSYQDLAKSLHKSPHTVKNQLRQLIAKSDIFDKTTDTGSKNRFKLKKHLKIETDLAGD